MRNLRGVLFVLIVQFAFFVRLCFLCVFAKKVLFILLFLYSVYRPHLFRIPSARFMDDQSGRTSIPLPASFADSSSTSDAGLFR